MHLVLLTALGVGGATVFGTLLGLEWGAYLLLDFFYSYIIAQEKGFKYFLPELIFFPAFHWAYGIGSLFGIAALPKFLKDGKKDGKKKEKDGKREGK